MLPGTELLQDFCIPRQAGVRDRGFRGRFGAGANSGGAAAGGGATASGADSVKTLRTKPGGTVAVRIARSPDCSIFRLLKKVFTSASVPCVPMLPSAARKIVRNVAALSAMAWASASLSAKASARKWKARRKRPEITATAGFGNNRLQLPIPVSELIS